MALIVDMTTTIRVKAEKAQSSVFCFQLVINRGAEPFDMTSWAAHVPFVYQQKLGTTLTPQTDDICAEAQKTFSRLLNFQIDGVFVYCRETNQLQRVTNEEIKNLLRFRKENDTIAPFQIMYWILIIAKQLKRLHPSTTCLKLNDGQSVVISTQLRYVLALKGFCCLELL